ncbi:MAG: hypothetical protein NZL88_10010, partial [Gaiellaceae bacterium]|nr:hypothetical protein [Gaiellaceae bacterium]
MATDDLLRRGLESVRAQAELERQRAEAIASDRAYLEGRIPEFVDALNRFLQLMSERGNPGLQRWRVNALTGFTRLTTAFRGTPGWMMGDPLYDGSAPRVVTPSGTFASYHAGGWLDPAQ